MFIYKRCSCSKKPTSNQGSHKAERLARVMKIISTASRIRIMTILENGPHCVSDIQTHTGLSQTLISHHLNNFMEVGLAKNSKDKTFVEYSLTPKGLKLIEFVHEFTDATTVIQGATKIRTKRHSVGIFKRLFGST